MFRRLKGLIVPAALERDLRPIRLIRYIEIISEAANDQQDRSLLPPILRCRGTKCEASQYYDPRLF